MKLSVESRDQGFGSTTSNESSLNESIDDLKLSPEKKDELKKILQQSDQTDKQKSDFIAKLKSADPAVADTAISFLKMRPDANLTAVGVVTEKLSAELSTQGSPVEQLVEEQGDDVFDTLYKVAEEDEANVDESLKALQSPNGYAAQYSTKAMNAVNMLHTVMSGGQLANPHLQQTFEKYASAPNPFAALSTDLNAVESLNSQFSGTGTFTLRDLGEMNLDSTYTNLLDPRNVTTDEYKIVAKSWSEFHKKISRFIKEENFKWEVPDSTITILNNIYFDKSGTIDYYTFKIKNPSVSTEKRTEYEKVLQKFSKEVRLDLNRDEKYAQCGKTKYLNY